MNKKSAENKIVRKNFSTTTCEKVDSDFENSSQKVFSNYLLKKSQPKIK